MTHFVPPREFQHLINAAMRYWHNVNFHDFETRLDNRAKDFDGRFYDPELNRWLVKCCGTIYDLEKLEKAIKDHYERMQAPLQFVNYPFPLNPGKKTMTPKQLFDSLKQIYPNLIRIEFGSRGDHIVGVFEHLRGLDQGTQYCHHILSPSNLAWNGEEQYPPKGISPKKAFDAIKTLYPDTKFIRKEPAKSELKADSLVRVETDEHGKLKETYHAVNVDWGRQTHYPHNI